MKKLITSAFLLLFLHQLSAETLYEQLCRFNFNWKKYAMRAPAGEARAFHSDKEYIQAHLSNVLVILRSNPTEQLNAQQLQSRNELINVLDAYRVAGIFPMNYYRAERLPVFIDEHQTHCAVGFLMRYTGHEAMALRIAAADNYAWVKDIHDPELGPWQVASGFTVEELKLIQGAYDSYLDNALFLPNKYEIPQKPEPMLVYFENETMHKPMAAKPENVWCKGEGTNGVLNGRWEQNYAVGIPWIVGYYENGKRTGQWQEYYQGTKVLCRTENWRNNKLNGVRKRFDRFGNLIEEILFRNGNAILKTNYSLGDSLTYIRKPVDSNLVYTEIFNSQGALLAAGHERIYNPGNLLWFQNIELTALNSISVQARDLSSSSQIYLGNQPYLLPHRGRGWVYTPPLVEYKKEGDWKYYKEYKYSNQKTATSNLLLTYYPHFGQELLSSVSLFENAKVNSAYDSIHVTYDNNYVQHFYGYGVSNYLHIYMHYYTPDTAAIRRNISIYGYQNPQEQTYQVEYMGQYNQANERIGQWKYYNKKNQVYKTENYLVAWKEEEEKLTTGVKRSR